MEEHEERIEHKIVIDQYTEVTLKIPKTLTAMGLKALMMKANKLFNLSEIQEPVQKRKYVYKKKPGRPRKIDEQQVQRRGRNSTLWNEERVSYLKKQININSKYKEKVVCMNKKFNTDVFTLKNIQKKYYNLRQNNKWDKIKVYQDEE